jgi:hypothetical protein
MYKKVILDTIELRFSLFENYSALNLDRARLCS